MKSPFAIRFLHLPEEGSTRHLLITWPGSARPGTRSCLPLSSAMKPSFGPWLLLGPSLALCTGLLAAPPTETSGAHFISDVNPGQPIGRPLGKTEPGSSGRPKPSESPLLGSEERISKGLDPSVNPVPAGKGPLRGKLISIENPELASEAAFPKKGCVPKKENSTTTSGDKATVPSAQPGTHTASTRPGPDRKPASSAAGHAVAPQEPVHGGTPAPNNGSAVHCKPPPGNAPAPAEKPESGGKPKPEEQPEEEEDDSDDDDDVVVSEDYLSTPGYEDSKKENDDGFDRELDYGLGRSPFNPEEYHDGWSEEESDDPQSGFEEDTFSYEGGEPAFDAWGDATSPTASD